MTIPAAAEVAVAATEVAAAAITTTAEFPVTKLKRKEAVRSSRVGSSPTSGRCCLLSALRDPKRPAAFHPCSHRRDSSCSRVNSLKLVTARICPSVRLVRTRVRLRLAVATSRRNFPRCPATIPPIAARNGSAASTPATNTASAGKSASPTTAKSVSSERPDVIGRESMTGDSFASSGRPDAEKSESPTTESLASTERPDVTKPASTSAPDNLASWGRRDAGRDPVPASE